MLNKFIHVTEVLSLDICLGAVGSSLIASAILQSAMNPAIWVILPLSVWFIYTGDHLADAWKLRKESSLHSIANAIATESTTRKLINVRHMFHYRNFRGLFFFWCIAGVSALTGAILYLREIVVLGGITIGVMGIMHIILAFWGKFRFGKEFSVGIIYTVGVWFAPILNRTVNWDYQITILLLLFFLSALQNLFMTALLEYEMDTRENQVFGAGFFSHESVSAVLYACSLLSLSVLFVTIFWFFLPDRPALARPIFPFWIILFLNSIPGALLYLQKSAFFKKHYRPFAEWAFSAGFLTLLIK